MNNSYVPLGSAIFVEHTLTGRQIQCVIIGRNAQYVEIMVGMTRCKLYPNRLHTAYYGEVGSRHNHIQGASKNGQREVVYHRSTTEVARDRVADLTHELAEKWAGVGQGVLR